MRVELNNYNTLLQPNNAALRPYKGEILYTIGFNQYSARKAINAKELKNRTPNDKRFEDKDLLPSRLSGTSYKQNLDIRKYKSRNLDEHLLAHIPSDMPVPG